MRAMSAPREAPKPTVAAPVPSTLDAALRLLDDVVRYPRPTWEFEGLEWVSSDIVEPLIADVARAVEMIRAVPAPKPRPRPRAKRRRKPGPSRYYTDS